MSPKAVEELLSYQSGLLGLSGRSNDMRTLRAAAPQMLGAQFAIDYFIERIAEHIAKLTVTLGGLDGLIFTSGISENDAALRAAVKAKLKFLSDFETLAFPLMKKL